jgi:acyl-CoA reductase-like NAD-dependent aldehyde dehydrogenase
MDRTLTTHHKGDYLQGSFYRHGSDGEGSTSDPATGIELDRVHWRRGAVDQALVDAAAAGDEWGARSPSQRIDRLRRVADALEERRKVLAPLVSREMGKPRWEAEQECLLAVSAISLLLERAGQLLAERRHPGADGSVVRRPLGTVAAITPYPHPVLDPLRLLIPALAAGNAVVWKPSSEVPLVSQLVTEAFDGCRLPPGLLSVVHGPGPEIGACLAASDVPLVAAACSRATGEAIRAKAGRAWLQTGGKGWAIVCRDADLDRAAVEIVSGAFLTAGQRARSTARLLVDRRCARDLLKRVVALTDGLTTGPPSSTNTFAGPLVSRRAREQFDLVLQQWGSAVEFAVEGGSGQLPPSLRRKHHAYVSPAIALTEGELPPSLTPPEDVEGPLLLAVLVDDAESAVEAYNAHPYGLAASVFTESKARFGALAAQLRCGSVNWNRGTVVESSRFPNAGLRGSGNGAEANGDLALAASWAQSTLAATGRLDPSRRPPGMAWPADVMGVIDPTSLVTPPYNPADDTTMSGIDTTLG